MAEEPVVGYDGFEAAGDAGAGGAEDNLSMSLGDFMAFLETEPTSPEEGWKEEQQMQPAVNQGCLEMPANTDCSEDLFQSHEAEMLENAEFWSKSNYSPVEHLECHMEVNMELNEGEQMIDHTEASRYELFSNDLQSQSRTSNLDNEHFPRDASNHANVEATGPPYDLSNGGISTEHSDWSEIKWGSTDEMLGNTGQDDDHFTPMGMFCLTNNTDILDLSCIESNMGERTESIRNGNSSCLTMQEEHLQAECGGYPHPDYISVDMIDERSLHDLPHGLSQNNEQYEMEQLPQNICESGSMQMASPDQYCSSPDQYCDDTSLSDFYMDVSSPESISCEQNQPEDIFFKSESSTDSSPVPSSRNSTTEDADKYLGQPSKQLLDSKIVPFSNQHTFKNMEYQKPLVLDKQYAYRSNNSSIHNSTKGCFSRDGDMVSDLCVLEGNRNPAPAHLWPYQGKFHHNFQQPVYGNSIIPAFGGTRYKPHDERTTLRLALQDISQPNSEANPPDGVLAVPLLRHQKIALSWMVKKETSISLCYGGILADDQGLGKTVSAISLILTERPPVPQSSTKNEPCEAVTLDEDDDCIGPHSEKLMRTCSSQVTSNTVKQENPIVAVKARPAAGTLVVCPTSVLRQWAGELKNKVTSKANLSFLIYHGSNRTKDPNELTKYDVVLTTYSIVSMEVPKQSNPDSDGEEKGKPDPYGAPVSSSGSKKRKASSSKKTKNKSVAESCLPEKPLAKVAWFRVILDEAQSIKNYRTQVARACWGLRAKRRWCLSGTPIQNAVEDLYSYFRFLRYNPYAVYKQFCTLIKIPISRNPNNGYKKLQAVLKPVMLRRTKATMLDGEPIISLPPKTVSLKTVDFTSEERGFYNTLEVESREQFKEYAAAGTVKQNYVNILLMLLRLRQACDHPHLVRGYDSCSSWMSSLEMVKKLPMERQHKLLICLQSCSAFCALCNDAPEDPVVTLCGHVFCNQCILEQLTGDDSVCPVSNCRVRLNTSSLFSRGTLECSLSKLASDFKSDDTCMEMIHAEKRPGMDSSYASSKLRAALDILLSLPKIDPTIDSKCSIGIESEKFDGKGISEQTDTKLTEKAIVFSQWTRMLDLLEVHLKASHVTYRRLDGTMSVAARDKAVNDFNMVPEVTVMIMSLKAASLGLNMVAACHVLMLDLWWNPTTEDQAVDRAHRIGQKRPVTVSRLTIKDTVEDRILALQEKKREMVASAFGEDKSGSRQTRLTVEDLNYLFMV
ncbi:helicase-like transcription factor CHR28 isoform X1 [Zea mays]|uniref:SNF2 domain-containing protein / helicase domain-containing protein / zinc finger protein-related n=5 Tax=Zea mays TaxID=4577 RepID=A0A1D6GA81_MAIZE|nr:helicase-like transcription factor CHR28 isoform X1 [Zea mays]AQK99994.1 SNF2 domain-containing protein / helicase domain-containing protein / zinc finger protein-related [Zea mays]AQK99999.1 SNF2 domain-containing protein / helicase domain-containing protein / zinc finger protein-related [Zea mays]|eukprot:XP_008657175.1 helicase-like transcription factor CHR28 isoform X1 [Zea mays]